MHRSCCSSSFIFEILDFYPISLASLFASLSCFLGRKLFSAVTEALHLPDARPKGRKERARARVASFLLSDSFRCGQALRSGSPLGVDVNHARQSRAGRGRKCVKDPRYLARFLSYPRLFLITPSLSLLLQVSEAALCIQFGAGRSNVERKNGLERV